MHVRRAVTAFAATFIVASTVPEAFASSVAVRLGFFSPRISSELWDENLDTFAVERSDFDAFIGGVELAVPVSRRVDVSVGVASATRTTTSNYLDFVRDDDTEIIQDIRLRDTPVTVGVRFLPLRSEERDRHRGRRDRRSSRAAYRPNRVNPYVSAGLGLHFYEYREEGEFIDFDTFDIFVDRFTDRGLALGGYVGGGVEFRVSRQILVFGEYRRHWASGEHGDDFEGFGPFDLDAHEVTGGIALRF